MLYEVITEEPETMQRSPIHNLTDRELEIFEMIGKGVSSGRIAKQLHLSVKTISAHRERIKQKLGIKSSGELVRYAILWLAKELS